MSVRRWKMKRGSPKSLEKLNIREIFVEGLVSSENGITSPLTLSMDDFFYRILAQWGYQDMHPDIILSA